MNTPSLSNISSALRSAMATVIGTDATMLAPGADGKPNLAEILVIHAVNPGKIESGELGGRQGASVLYGVFSMNLSFPKNNLPLSNNAWNLSDKLMHAFYRRELTTPDECSVFCDESYVTNVGNTPDGRQSLLVTVPWWTWTGGEGE